MEGDDLQADLQSVSKALDWMSRNVDALSQAVADRQHMENWIKVVEAQEKARNKSEPAHAQERDARASAAYGTALEAFRDASRREQKLRYTWQLCQTVIDVFRTKSANERRV